MQHSDNFVYILLIKLIFHKYRNLENMPMGDELKWLLKKGRGFIFESCDISKICPPHVSSHAVSLVRANTVSPSLVVKTEIFVCLYTCISIYGMCVFRILRWP